MTLETPTRHVARTAADCMSANLETGEVCSFALFHTGRHSWHAPEPLQMRAQLAGVHRTGKKGVELDFVFVDVDYAAVARLFGVVGGMVTLTIAPEAEQAALPLGDRKC